MCNFLSDTTFISSLAGAGFGAGLAFLLNAKREKNKNTQKNIEYLTYTIFILSNIVDELYGLKKIYMSKMDEFGYVRSAMKIAQDHSSNVKLEKPLKILANTIQCDVISFPINIEKLNFVSDSKPALISLLFATEKSIKSHNVIFEQLNKFILENFHNEEKNPSQLSFGKLANYTTNWGEEIDSGLYLSETLQEVLIEYGKRKYNDKFKVLSTSIAKEYEVLKPPTIECWEFIKQWKNATWMEKHLPVLNKLYTKIKSKGKQ